MARKKSRTATKKTAASSTRGSSGKDRRMREDDHNPRPVDAVDNSSDDEEIDEDMAFNSDDERMYGAFFAPSAGKKQAKGKKKKEEEVTSDDESDDESGGSSDDSGSDSDSDDDDDDDGIASDDDDEHGDGGQYMLDLLENLDKQKADKKAQPAAASTLLNSIPESQFTSSIVRGSKLTMDELMGSITDTRGYKSLQKTVASISGVRDPFDKEANKKVLTTTKTPAPRVVSERAQRKVHYDHQKAEMSLWNDAVKQNREAESLDFRPKGRITITRDDLVEKFEPQTDFEREVADVLEKAGAAEEAQIAKRERRQLLGEHDDHDNDHDDDLGRSKLTLEQYKERQGQLAKMRALLFYEEQKQHRINKIKAKKYRKIRKKRREAAKRGEIEAMVEDDPELARELEEKEEMERMKERMTLAHKNTSKWARQQLKRGKNVDLETRRALSAQIKVGDDLRQKMRSIRDGDEEEEDEEGQNNDNLVAKAKAILEETTNDAAAAAANSEDGGQGPRSGLFRMAFMQRGLQRQRERAREEAKQLLEELEQNVSDAEADNDDYIDSEADRDGSRQTDGESNEKKAKATKVKIASVKETEKILPPGKLMASQLEFGHSDSVQVTDGISVDISQQNEGTANHVSSSGEADKSSGRSYGKKGEAVQGRVSGTHGSTHITTMTVSNKPPADESDIHVETNRIESRGDKENQNSRTASLAIAAKTTSSSVSEKVNSGSQSSNPWLRGAASKVSKGGKEKTKGGVIDVKGAASILTDKEDSNDISKEKQTEKDGSTAPNNSSSETVSTVQLSQEELVRRAFAAPTDVELEEDLEEEKEAMRKRDDPTRKTDEKKALAGWGSWAGEGVPPPRPRKFPKGMEPPSAKKTGKRKRKDDGLRTVIINEKRSKKNLSFQINAVPYPYTSRQEYEKAMAGATGKEWNVTSAVKNMTRPEIQTRTGRIIRPLGKKAKAKRAPAKF